MPLARKLRPFLIRITAVGMATLAALALVELALRLWMPQPIYVDMRNVIQHVCTRPDPAIQYVNREGYAGEFNNREFRTHVRINSRGLRDREYPYEKTPDRRRVVVLGDSFAFGWGVEAEETSAKVMEASLRGVDVLNTACSGWGTHQELLYLQREGIRYHPDLVLLFFCENDPENNTQRYHFMHGKLYDATEAPGLSADVRRFLIKHCAVWNLVRHAVINLRRRQPATGLAEDTAALWETEARDLADMAACCRVKRARLAVVYVPSKNGRGEPTYGEWFPRLREWCAAARTPMIDPTPALQEMNRSHSAYYRLDDHWTRYGHQAVAAAAIKTLVQRGWLPAGPGPRAGS